MNLRLDVAYDGAPFRGFARQPNVRTVQGELETALGSFFSREVDLPCAGRTDAGVHATGQVVGLADAPDEVDLGRLRDALNGMCGPAIAVWSCTPMPSDWHPRFSARSRTYVYSIYEGAVLDPFYARTALHQKQALDVAAMREAAGHLVGEHDFSSFGRLPAPDSTPVRTLFELRVRRNGSFVTITARANSFIQQMVRSLVGTLVRVGSGHTVPEEIRGVLAARDRKAAGPVAPPHGLCLVSVEYDEGWYAGMPGPGTSRAPEPSA